MSKDSFTFKQFSVRQDRCAMKVGTDGVLLGAWTEIPMEAESALDIGTGTGLIALQLAQRSDCEQIDALEIEDKAFEQAVENFENSPWPDRLFCYHASLEEFVQEMDEKYDLVVSNPPFYTDTFKDLPKERAMARHSRSLGFDFLLGATEKLLSANGQAAFILPSKEEENFLEKARQRGLFPVRITRVRGNVKSSVKRVLIQLCRHKADVEPEYMSIEKERHVYTPAFRDLVKEFYLKL